MAWEPTTVQQLEHELKAAERRAQVLGLAVLIALGRSDLSSTISAGAPRWLFFVFFVLAFVAGFSVSRGWVEGHAGQRRIDLAATLTSTIKEACRGVVGVRVERRPATRGGRPSQEFTRSATPPA